MADTAKSKIVLDLAQILDEHSGVDTLVLDIREQSSWTDYFVISTVSSHAHMKGILRYVREYLSNKQIVPLHPHKNSRDDGWMLIDCGSFIVHLMSAELRGFYELERLWYTGKVLYHSSKSS